MSTADNGSWHKNKTVKVRKIQYYERLYAGHGEIYECFYETPKCNGVHIAYNTGDRLPSDDRPIYIAVFGDYFGVGSHPWNALLSLQSTPKKLIRANSELWYGAAEQSEITNPILRIWIQFNTLFLCKH